MPFLRTSWTVQKTASEGINCDFIFKLDGIDGNIEQFWLDFSQFFPAPHFDLESLVQHLVLFSAERHENSQCQRVNQDLMACASVQAHGYLRYQAKWLASSPKTLSELRLRLRPLAAEDAMEFLV